MYGYTPTKVAHSWNSGVYTNIFTPRPYQVFQNKDSGNCIILVQWFVAGTPIVSQWKILECPQKETEVFSFNLQMHK